MKFKLISVVVILLTSFNTYAVTECTENIVNYFVGTSEVNQSDAHLWVYFESGGSAGVSSKSAAFDGMLSTVIRSIAANKTVKVRYKADNVACKMHHDDWIGIWLYK
ncbi:hypothetical protein ACQEXU_21730 [Vibrio sp. TRT 21S02]|uniref:hypothetical protein n=1 Tax=Vibrio sp. TRT 21S02 TaxID=3418507 RepID=UPI003CE8585D